MPEGVLRGASSAECGLNGIPWVILSDFCALAGDTTDFGAKNSLQS
jgi:hypothetical protein